MNYFRPIFYLIIIFSNGCKFNYRAEEKRVYKDLAKNTYKYDAQRSNLEGLIFENIDSLQLKLNENKTFSFISTDTNLSKINGIWRLSDFPEIQYWIFKVGGEENEQWNEALEVNVKKDSLVLKFAFSKAKK